MIGREDDGRLVVESLLLECGHHLADHAVNQLQVGEAAGQQCLQVRFADGMGILQIVEQPQLALIERLVLEAVVAVGPDRNVSGL